MSIGELFIELGFAGNTEQLEKFNKKIKEVAKNMDLSLKSAIKTNTGVANFVKGIGALAGAITGAAIAANKFTNDLVQSNQALLDLTRTTDIAQGTFQKWGSIGKMLGVENADQQLASLNQRLFDLMLTGEGARGFQLAGINPMGQDAEGVLEQLRARISGMNDTTATYLLQQMGIDPKMLYLLRIGRKEFEELGRTIEKYQLSRDDTKKIQAMNIQLQIAGIKLKYLKDKAIMTIMPAWTRFMESITGIAEMLAKVGQEVGKFVVKWRGLVGAFALGLTRLEAVKNFFGTISKSITSLITKIPILGRFLGALGGIAAKALLPFTALFLLLDDFAVFSQGGNSVIGEVLKWFEETGEDFSKIFDKMFGGDFIGGLQETFIKIVDVLDDFVQVLLRIGEILTGLPLTKWGKNIANGLSQGNYDKLKNYEYGQATGGAAPIDYNVKVELPEWVHNMLTGVANNQKGYEGTLPNLSSMFVTPSMQRNLSYNTSNTNNMDNRQINQNISIQSSQPVFDIQKELTFARNAMASGWA